MGQETQIKVLGMRYWGELRDTGDGLLFLCPPVPRLPNALTRETTSPLPPLPSGQWEAPPGARGSQGRPHVSDPPSPPHLTVCMGFPALPVFRHRLPTSPSTKPLSTYPHLASEKQRYNCRCSAAQSCPALCDPWTTACPPSLSPGPSRSTIVCASNLQHATGLTFHFGSSTFKFYF